MPDFDLWMTARCAADLKLDWPDDEGVAAVQNDLVEKFVHLRSSDPEPQGDQISSLDPRCYGFRFNDMRGVSWYDRDEGCVFLVAGDLRRDIYEQVLYLHSRGELLPSAADYDDLYFFRLGRWRRELRDEHGPDLVRRAQTEPETPFIARLGRADVTVIAFNIDTGGWLLQVLVETPAGAEPLTLDGADEVARSALEHLRTPVVNAPRFLGLPVDYYSSFAFDAIIDA